jgi:uncharacterized protein (DUF488 family)
LTELLTVGHGTQSADDLAVLLRGAGVSALIDVRIAPGSRRNPQFMRAELERWLPDTGVAYRWDKRLGGYRKLAPDSPDTALRNDSFRAYAGYMRTAEFAAGLAELIEQARSERTTVMCSETVWWRCHRRLIADHLMLLDGLTPLHLMPGGRLSDHRPTSGVSVGDGVLVYDRNDDDPVSAPGIAGTRQADLERGDPP